ncbi:MAG: hypothetical protein U1C74_22990 [Phenylobacterium sp.]|nr:hypothetical protein [Phenylobacterium sp.]
MPASLLFVLALFAQPVPDDDGPVQTAPKAAAVADVPGLDEMTVEPSPATAGQPADEVREPPPVAAAPTSLTIQQKTLVQGETLQVVLGQRALFRLDDKGLPVLAEVEEGKLAAAHPEGAVTETFAPPPDGMIAVALDGSAAVRATILKVWNQTDRALDYSAIALIFRQGNVVPAAAPTCAVAAGDVRTETWKRPVVAVGLSRFNSSATARPCDLPAG